MGPKPKYRNCKCSLEAHPHQVPDAQWNAHKEKHRASLVDATAHAVLFESNAGSSPVPDQSQFTTEALNSLTALISERTTQPKQPTRQAQSDALLKSILEGIERAVIAIQEAKSASQDVELHRKKMNEALDEVLLAARSLKPSKESPEKSFVAGRLTDLELLVEDLRATLPEDKAPLFYDSAYATENPIANLEVMAQVMILFGLVCNTIKSAPAYQYNFPSLDTEVPDKCKLNPPQEKHVSEIYKLLVHQLCDDAASEDGDSDGDSDENDDENEDDSDIGDKNKSKSKPKPKAGDDDDKDEITLITLSAKLAKKLKPSLVFVCWALQLPAVIPSIVPKTPRKNAKPRKDAKVQKEKPNPLTREEYLVRLTRAQLADLLVDWRLGKPLRDETGNLRTQSKAIDKTSFRFVQDVIANTTIPAWVNHVPKNYGEKGAGSIKADEWRLLGTIYVPIALGILWGEQDHKAELLKQSMALFQAVTLVCRFGTNPERASAFRNFLKEWVDKLYECHPHTTIHKKRTNVHVAFHIYDFLLLFGPVLSWWCFPIERLIGVLQKINTNNHVGGEHEATVLRTWMRSANLRRWLNRKDCPELLRQFDRLYSIFVTNRTDSRKDPEYPASKSSDRSERAHYDYEEMHFSRASTHLGNSLVSFLDPQGVAVFGSIEKIEVTQAEKVQFVIRPQAPLPPNVNDPFKPFPHFPARTYSSKMSDTTVIVDPGQVIGHYARYNFSNNCAVVLDLLRG
ncbi:hypothetical protein MVEN_01713500 [Mycena venus]|uniref:Uncharacterized protein n=1 Tax=Mycena venus TaxID=2733690 RepID=A0A8H6XPQ8_9AGAR|nr:hypothetical protein MVEN_01713500 [Mycena venus]